MKTEKDYFQDALHTFNIDKPNWYGWKTHDDNGDKIPGKERMQYKYIKVIITGATIPSEADVNAKIQEIKDKEKAVEDLKASAKANLIAGKPLSEKEANLLFW